VDAPARAAQVTGLFDMFRAFVEKNDRILAGPIQVLNEKQNNRGLMSRELCGQKALVTRFIDDMTERQVRGLHGIGHDPWAQPA
jgi:hypothetical protein